MNREELFEKYSIKESHDKWDMSIDNWYSVEIFREMHGGELPNGENEKSILYVTKFLDKCHDDVGYFFSLKNNGSFYMTAKRMIYRHCDLILKELIIYTTIKSLQTIRYFNTHYFFLRKKIV